ncbi:hypothetical protein FCM35_KLT06848 [Carex littledalei]|uniref:Uncharacterized protein n=1 Tax=Carex littledalei TaxID=544730 RepID=A0A833V830_9POAL|nr:hypothetical protein FCM35_KLT06848 [Carex littledalei]
MALDESSLSLFAQHSVESVDLVVSDLSRPRWENIPESPTIEGGKKSQARRSKKSKPCDAMS